MRTAFGVAGVALSFALRGTALTVWQNTLAIATAVVPAGKVPTRVVMALRSATTLHAALMSATTVCPLGIKLMEPLGETLVQPEAAANAANAAASMSLRMLDLLRIFLGRRKAESS